MPFFKRNLNIDEVFCLLIKKLTGGYFIIQMIRFLSLSFLLSPLLVFSQPKNVITDNSLLGQLLNTIKTYNSNHFFEKIHLQFDKTGYEMGDTVYFKAYVTQNENHIPTQLSRVLYVDLINADKIINQSLKIQIVDGIAYGDFVLPIGTKNQDYIMRVYTQFLKKAGNENILYQSINIQSNYNITENTTGGSSGRAPAHYKPVINFFPESGVLVAGVRSKLAFKAINADGSGIDLKGAIINPDGKKVKDFSS